MTVTVYELERTRGPGELEYYDFGYLPARPRLPVTGTDWPGHVTLAAWCRSEDHWHRDRDARIMITAIMTRHSDLQLDLTRNTTTVTT